MKKNFLNLKKLEQKINFGFFTSRGGVSKGDFLSLNCSKNNNDNKKNVCKNINIALKNLNIVNKKLKLINQIHSKKIFLVNKNNFHKKMIGDGLLTEDNNIVIGVLTADCAPIFLFDNNKTLICCLHSGWKGALANISREALIKFKKKKIKNRDINVVIGPCLAFDNFEVHRDFKNKFIKKNPSYKIFFKTKNSDKDLFNLRELINFQFKNEGIKNIFNIKKDTYKNKNIFFSYRRAIHENKSHTGRMINLISFKD